MINIKPLSEYFIRGCETGVGDRKAPASEYYIKYEKSSFLYKGEIQITNL